MHDVKQSAAMPPLLVLLSLLGTGPLHPKCTQRCVHLENLGIKTNKPPMIEFEAATRHLAASPEVLISRQGRSSQPRGRPGRGQM